MKASVEVLTVDGQPTGRRATPDEVTSKGYWHEGVHGLIYTPNGSVIVQKRAKDIVFHPRKLDFSVGGFVDFGESPEQAMIREVQEELGLTISRSNLKYLGVIKYNHHWPSLGKIDRVFIHRFLVKMDRNSFDIRVQASEVEWAKLLSLKDAKKLIREGHVHNLANVESTLRFYENLMDDLSLHIGTLS